MEYFDQEYEAELRHRSGIGFKIISMISIAALMVYGILHI